MKIVCVSVGLLVLLSGLSSVYSAIRHPASRDTSKRTLFVHD